jgi:excisionase family DNA binding protein
MTYSVKQIRERLKVSDPTVLAWIASGELVAINVSRKRGRKPRWRITEESLQAFELLRASAPQPPRTKRRSRKPADVVKFY